MSDSKKKEIYVVLGMHRSGTSTITRALEVFNISLGDALVGSKEGENDKGFFEDNDIYQFDRKLESTLDSDWHYLGPVEEKEIALLCEKGLFEEAVDLIQSKTDSFNLFGFKDPRVARLLPFWIKVFEHCNIKANYILIIRNPVSVARSLESRDKLAVEKSYLLWLSHILPCLRDTEGKSRIVADYDLLLKQPEQQLARLGRVFDLDINQNELGVFLDEFLDSGLRHDYSSVADLKRSDACYPLVTEVYATLLQCVENESAEPCVEPKTMESWLAEFNRIKPFFSLMDKLDATLTDRNARIASLEHFQQENEHLNKQIEHDKHMLAEREKHLEHMIGAYEGKVRHVHSLEYTVKQNEQLVTAKEEALAEQNQTIAELGKSVDKLKAELSQASSDLEQKQLDITQQQQDISSKIKHIDEKNQLIASYFEQITSYEQQIASYEQQIASYEQQIASSNQHLTELRNSLSWKVTRPLRAIKLLFSKKTD